MTQNYLIHNINQKKLKTYKFDKGIEIWANHHQALCSKLSMPRFFKNLTPHSGLKPPDNEANLYIHTQWNRKATRSL